MFTAGWNMPGTLPEMDPEEFEGFGDAKSFIVEEMEEQWDEENDDDVADHWREVIAGTMTNEKEFSEIGPDGYVYWVVDDQTGSRRGL